LLEALQPLIPRSRKLLGALSLLLVAGMLAACLYPFRVAPNAVAWSPDGQGITFGNHGVVLGSQPLRIPSNTDDAFSMELWLRPEGNKNHDQGSILGFYTPEHPRLFTIDQRHTGVALRRYDGGQSLYTADVLLLDRMAFLTITSDEQRTAIYANGARVRDWPGVRIPNRLLAGRLILGTTAAMDDSWPGTMRGVAIYSRALNAAQVKQHYATWTAGASPDADGLLALYRFDGGSGHVIANQAPGASGELRIPEQYTIPAKDVLEPVEFDHPNDIIANIIGFMPLGFTLYGFLTVSRMRARIMVVALLCGAFSVSIELMQVMLPTRDSSQTDVLTNILGGVIGAWIYRALTASAVPKSS